MIYKKISLSKTDTNVFLEVYVAEQIGDTIRDAILVIPGGGYGWVCADREGEAVAHAFLARGMQAFVLHYSVGEGAKFPAPLIQASLAVQYIRAHAEEFHLDPQRIFACGFSAGGHLCAALGTMWHLPEIYKEAKIPFGANKIAGMLPIYPVISALVPGTHMPSFYNILGTTAPTQEELERYSLELRVDEKTVPAFLVHTASDPVVAVGNTLRFASALTDHKIFCEVHIYPDGPHGMALANHITDEGNPQLNIPTAAHWIEQAMDFINAVGK